MNTQTVNQTGIKLWSNGPMELRYLDGTLRLVCGGIVVVLDAESVYDLQQAIEWVATDMGAAVLPTVRDVEPSPIGAIGMIATVTNILGRSNSASLIRAMFDQQNKQEPIS